LTIDLGASGGVAGMGWPYLDDVSVQASCAKQSAPERLRASPSFLRLRDRRQHIAVAREGALPSDQTMPRGPTRDLAAWSAPNMTATVIGALPSPFVRKVLAVLELKRIPYEIDPIIPFFGDERFSKLSPLRRIPVFIDDKVTLADSSVICQYLEDRYPEPRAYPTEIVSRAQARWLEEFADTRMADVCVWRIFYPAVVKPHVFGAKRDPEAVGRAIKEELPQVLGYLEQQAPPDGFLFGELSIADISLAVHLRNLRWARAEPAVELAPKALAWLARVEAHPALAKVTAIADKVVRTPPAEQRALIRQMGLGVTADSLGGAEPRRGPMTV
jgi:glutathione S-transferase